MKLIAACVLVLASVLLAESYEQYRHSSSVYYGHNARGWIKKQRVADFVKVPLVFAIKQQNVDKLEEILLQVSDPTHPAWGKHLSLEEVGSIVSDWEATNAVHAWLLSNGVAQQDIDLTVNGDFIRVRLPARRAEALLSCEFNYYAHPSQPHVLSVRTEMYRLPLEVADRVDFVGYTVHSVTPQPRRVREALPSQLVEMVRSGQIPPGYCVPQTLFTYYGISNPSVASSSATQSVYENLGQSYSPADLSAFFAQFNLPNNSMSTVIGPNDPNACSQDPNNCVEADLDVEYIMAVAQNSPTTFWSIANGDNEPFVDWIVAVANSTTPPLVHSISYGDIETQDDPTSMQRFNTEAMKLGARGVTIMVASGDDGVANFIARSDPTQCGFNPSFPATAPYVTAVGATSGPENNTAEIACTSQTGGGITTGGGFSTVFSQPAYQTSVVQNYLQNGPNMPPFSMFNKGGRGYPDVAMLGHNYIVVDGGQLSAGSGTSASSPVFAATVTLANGLRIAAGKSPLGFLNQVLYGFASTQPSVFNDITSGENNCCAGTPGNQTCCQYGFTATTGWDPLTGLGSIHFPAFSQALLNLP